MVNEHPVFPKKIENHLNQLAQLVNKEQKTDQFKLPLKLGIDLGTSDIVSVVVDVEQNPIAARLNWADVVRDGVVVNFHEAIKIVKQQVAELEKLLGVEFTSANTSYPPGTDAKISVNVIEAAGLDVSAVIDEPSAVAHLLKLDKAAVVDIGGGTTGIAILDKGSVVYSGDEATGGRHVTLTIAGSLQKSYEDAEAKKLASGKEVWPIVRPVFEKMADITRHHIENHSINALYLSGGSCMLPGVKDLFQKEFPQLDVILPENSIFFTPYAIAVYEA